MAQLERARVASPNLVIPAVILDSSSTTGAKLSTVVFNSTGLKITAQRELDAAATVYSVAGSTIETIATIGTYAAPTATKIRFAPVDATNAPGDYQLMISQALGGNGDASRWLKLTLSGVTNMAPVDILIQLDANEAADVYTRLGAPTLASISADIQARMATFTLPANFSSMVISAGGVVDASLKAILGTALTETVAGYLTAAFKKFFNVAAPTSTMNQLTLVDTTTNSTNAPTAGDLTATMKTSVTAAVPTAAAIAAATELAILNEGDGSQVLQAIIDKINATDTNLAGLTLGAIAQAVRDGVLAGAAANSLGAALNTLLGRNTPLDATATQAAAAAALNAYDAPTHTEMTTEVGAVAAAAAVAVQTSAATTPLHADVRRVNLTGIDGDGSDENPWRAAS